MNTKFRKQLLAPPGLLRRPCGSRGHQPGAYDTLPYTSRVLAENLVRRCDPATLNAS
jgi:aconitate hydratase